MKVNTPLLIGASLMLIAAVLPMTNVSAHQCTVAIPTPGCDPVSCPNGNDVHTQIVPPAQCTNPAARYTNCPHFSPHSHTYGSGGSAGAKSATATGGDEVGAGVVTVSETNTVDCNGDGIDGDYDGDYETGIGGAFFGYGPWADEPTCQYGLRPHGGAVVGIQDGGFGSNIWFVIGADDTSGPVVEVDPVDSSTSCSTDGSITPGDPATDPTADADDCLTDPMNIAQGVGAPYATCGAGGDGGYWVFLSGFFVNEDSTGVSAGNPPTAGTITA